MSLQVIDMSDKRKPKVVKKEMRAKDVCKHGQREVTAVCGINMKISRGVSITREQNGLVTNVWVTRKPMYDAGFVGLGIVVGLVLGWLL